MKKFLLITSLLAPLLANAVVKPAKIIQDCMVVEWTKPLTLWGTADPNEKFDIKINNARKSRVQADSNGNWEVKLPALKAGGPYTIQIGSSPVIVAKISLSRM